jgi:predicted DNA binding CopG/RHH family protein
MTEHQKQSRIPRFSSRQEEAEFWDSHDITDYLDELQPVEVKVSKNLSEGITVRLDEESLNELRSIAAEQGIGPTTLMRMWVLERLRELKNRRLAGS